jgi:hypothetical protein
MPGWMRTEKARQQDNLIYDFMLRKLANSFQVVLAASGAAPLQAHWKVGSSDALAFGG